MRRTDEIDHVDPKWAEGRDYQLVCGLNVVYNMAERDSKLNQRKSNRFLPWRNCHDEIGTDPVNPGDLCLFLDPDTGEWVLEEFMGEWWYAKTKRTAGCSQPYGESYKGNGRESGWLHTPETRVKMSESQRRRTPRSQETKDKTSATLQGRILTEEHKAKIGAKSKGRKHTEEHKAKMSAINTGKKLSAETKAKISAAHKGKKPSVEQLARLREAGIKGSTGRVISPETRAKMSAAQKGKKHTAESKAKMSRIHKGREHAEETKAKISATKKKRREFTE